MDLQYAEAAADIDLLPQSDALIAKQHDVVIEVRLRKRKHRQGSALSALDKAGVPSSPLTIFWLDFSALTAKRREQPVSGIPL